MLNVQTKRPRQREFRGPEPGSVAILARGRRNNAADKIIQDSRAEKEARAQVEAQVRQQQKCDLRGDWEKTTDKRVEFNAVKRRVDEAKRMYELSLDERRDKLRALLEAEQIMYIREMDASQETVIERQARMRERARQLKEKKEAERKALVEEKLDLQWRNQCEELRTTMSKRSMDEVTAERLDQLRLKDLIAQEKREEEKFFAQLWEEERLKKEAREERDQEAIRQRTREQMEVLQQQRAALEIQKQEAVKLREEEAKLLKEMQELLKIEEAQAAEERRRREKETRDMLHLSVRLKLKRRAREVQEELAFDMKILEQLLEETKNEAMAENARKRQLREEDRRYRDYLEKMKEEEIIRERELDKLVDAEIEKQWQKRLDQWDREKAARRALLKQVTEERKQQIQEKILRNERLRQEGDREKEEILRQIEANKLLDIQDHEAIHRRAADHNRDLLGQIEYNRQLAQERHEEDLREEAKYREFEEQYQRKLQAALNQEWVDPKLHPMRKKLLLEGRAF